MKMAYLYMIYDQTHSSSLLLISVLLCYSGGNDTVVHTSVGDDAVLPCQIDPTRATAEMTIHWSMLDLPPGQYVYFQRNGKELDDDKNPSFNGRTSVFMDEVKKGNVSLKLSRVESSDEGIYTCSIPDIKKEFTVQLIVGSKIPPQGPRGKSTTKMKLSCFRTTDPDSWTVTLICNGLVDKGFLWKGEQSDILKCLDTSPPASYSCVPCLLNQTVHVICEDIPERFQLVMKAVGGPIIDNMKADCPPFSEPRVSAGEFPWWGWLIITLFTITIIIIIIITRGLIYKRFCSTPP